MLFSSNLVLSVLLFIENSLPYNIEQSRCPSYDFGTPEGSSQVLEGWLVAPALESILSTSQATRAPMQQIEMLEHAGQPRWAGPAVCVY